MGAVYAGTKIPTHKCGECSERTGPQVKASHRLGNSLLSDNNPASGAARHVGLGWISTLENPVFLKKTGF